MTHPTHFKFTNALIKALPIQPTEAKNTASEYSDIEVSRSKRLEGRGASSQCFLYCYLYHGHQRAIEIGHWLACKF
ncbi:hypothetical protein HH682_15140 [Rosenbergiella sp. S61]|uniref:Uncharacterized protein n=1 Tax=Rosenbergiella gaditana TaxID=2726987 RepID=A0ABS5T037_9GAMM|nr:hypothetical protein [Rosenbergiella gaditana]MBT0725719.1 hypothetical protein [Rosenbergiella gaditana]